MMEYEALLDDLHTALDTPQTVMLGQPDGTWTGNLTTRSMYSEGSLRLPTAAASAAKERHDDQERKHMNAAYGSLWLRQNLARMAAA